jgi:hypothetical protein
VSLYRLVFKKTLGTFKKTLGTFKKTLSNHLRVRMIWPPISSGVDAVIGYREGQPKSNQAADGKPNRAPLKPQLIPKPLGYFAQ